MRRVDEAIGKAEGHREGARANQVCGEASRGRGDCRVEQANNLYTPPKPCAAALSPQKQSLQNGAFHVPSTKISQPTPLSRMAFPMDVAAKAQSVLALPVPH